MSDWSLTRKEMENEDQDKVPKFLGGIVSDISSRNAYTQMLIGAGSGWLTGFATMKVGKMAAFAFGGTIILVEVAHLQGYIKIDWDKMSSKLGKVTDKVETAVTGQSQNWMDKAERYVDRKMDRAEDALKRQGKKAKKWYHKLIGDENGPKVNDLHIFLAAFIGGVAIGIATS